MANIAKRNPENSEIPRVALYIRVSGEEQKIKGLSLEAQQERLESYARERGWIIAGIYIDAAKTARKNMHKRSEFNRMLTDVKLGKIDLLLFCRLDRWFRSVADYYKVMEILEE
nr:recombinase family protein [Lachnospiraceae bacterium]